MGSLPQFPQYKIEIILLLYFLLLAAKKMNELTITRKVVYKHRELCYYYSHKNSKKNLCAVDLENVMKERFIIFSVVCFSL